jgi:molybdopterin-containing oxidoreductase family iron-sulfur binding subunit
MGASLALAGLSGCVIQPAEKIVPYVSQPEEIIPGKPLFYATAMTLGGEAIGLLAKSNEGRPTKIEGNPDHPQSLGATDARAQASLLDMYDPDRSQEILRRGDPATWQNFMTELRARVDENRVDGGAGVRFLTETVTSPTLIAQMRQILTELPNARWYQYEPVNGDNAAAGAKMAFGTTAKAIYKFDQATRILSLDKDIFSDFNVRYSKDYNKSRRYGDDKKDIIRLYTIETTMTLTGAKSDHRLAVKPSQMPEIARAIAAALGVAGATSTYTENAQWIQAMARDLKANGGKSLVVAGDNQSPMVHALAHAMNQTLGAVGTTVTYVEPFQPFADVLQIDQLRQLITEIDNNAVKMLVILGGNPVYDSPVDLKLNADRMNKIPLRVHLGLYHNETAELCHWHIPAKHYLETWGDTRAFDGTVTIVQPLIQPLYDGKSIHEVAQLFFRENYDKRDFDIIRENWQRQGFGGAARATATTASQTQTSNQVAPPPADRNAAQRRAADDATTNATAQTQTGTLKQIKPPRRTRRQMPVRGKIRRQTRPAAAVTRPPRVILTTSGAKSCTMVLFRTLRRRRKPFRSTARL